jgi:hypothetical protein
MISEFRTYSPNVQSVMQDTLRTLADIDFAFEADVEKLDRSNAPKPVKDHIARELKERHREMREPYVRLLAELRTQVVLSPWADLKGRLAGTRMRQ